MSPTRPTIDLLVTKKIQWYRQGTTIVLAAGWLGRRSSRSTTIKETSSTRAMSTCGAVQAGARAPVPPLYGSGRPAFSHPYRPTRTRQDLACTSAGEPRTRV
jgi:hypothetical protein